MRQDPRKWTPRGDDPPSDWIFIKNLGDINPLDYGGYFIYKHKTGIYPEAAEKLLVDEDTYTVYRFPLDRLKLVDGYLVPLAYVPNWPHPLEKYDEWFHEELGEVAEFSGTQKAQLELAFTSADPVDRAFAYEAVGNHFGWVEFDSYPLTISRQEAEKRYRRALLRRRR